MPKNGKKKKSRAFCLVRNRLEVADDQKGRHATTRRHRNNGIKRCTISARPPRSRSRSRSSCDKYYGEFLRRRSAAPNAAEMNNAEHFRRTERRLRRHRRISSQILAHVCFFVGQHCLESIYLLFLFPFDFVSLALYCILHYIAFLLGSVAALRFGRVTLE